MTMSVKQAQTKPMTILIADDEHDLLELISYNLANLGHTIIQAHDGAEAIELAKSKAPDVLILDVMMPQLTGIEVAKRLRAQTETATIPIIMLTAKTQEADELAGLGAGADDYIAKPFSMNVLVARIQALSRRHHISQSDQDTKLTLGPVSINLDEHQASVDGQPIQLTITEFRLLCVLVSNQGKVLSRPALISNAIGQGVAVTERTIDVHVTALRRKIAPHSSMISTVRGVGYRADLPTNA